MSIGGKAGRMQGLVWQRGRFARSMRVTLSRSTIHGERVSGLLVSLCTVVQKLKRGASERKDRCCRGVVVSCSGSVHTRRSMNVRTAMREKPQGGKGRKQNESRARLRNRESVRGSRTAVRIIRKKGPSPDLAAPSSPAVPVALVLAGHRRICEEPVQTPGRPSLSPYRRPAGQTRAGCCEMVRKRRAATRRAELCGPASACVCSPIRTEASGEEGLFSLLAAYCYIDPGCGWTASSNP